MAFYSVEDENSYYDWFGAACIGDLDRLKELAKKKANGGDLAKAIASYKDNSGRAIFHFAAIAGRKRICKYLVEELKLNVDDFISGEGLTPLHSAILGDQHTLAVYLLDNGANPHAADNHGDTPMHMAAKIGPNKLLEYLIIKGAEIDAKSDFGTPLQFAASGGKKDNVKILLDNQANPNVTSHNLLAPMHSSILNGSIECVMLLLQAGAEPNFFSQGETPLGIAACMGETEIIKCLLNAGADPDIPNNVGYVPIEVAASLYRREAVMCLFPVTFPILTIADWSVDGILNYVGSKDATERMTETLEKNLLHSKSKGEEAFKRKDYYEAIDCYTEALSYFPTDTEAAAIYSNRSLCWARLNKGDYALDDAQYCFMRRPDWPKAYYRVGAACMILKKYKNAADAFYDGWKLDPKNKELEHAFLQAMEAQRMQST